MPKLQNVQILSNTPKAYMVRWYGNGQYIEDWLPKSQITSMVLDPVTKTAFLEIPQWLFDRKVQTIKPIPTVQKAPIQVQKPTPPQSVPIAPKPAPQAAPQPVAPKPYRGPVFKCDPFSVELMARVDKATRGFVGPYVRALAKEINMTITEK